MRRCMQLVRYIHTRFIDQFLVPEAGLFSADFLGQNVGEIFKMIMPPCSSGQTVIGRKGTQFLHLKLLM